VQADGNPWSAYNVKFIRFIIQALIGYVYNIITNQFMHVYLRLICIHNDILHIYGGKIQRFGTLEYKMKLQTYQNHSIIYKIINLRTHRLKYISIVFVIQKYINVCFTW